MDEKFNQLLKMIEQKADKAEVENLERRVTEKLNELIKNMIERFADKREVNKRLSLIEKQLKQLYDMMLEQGTGRG